MHAKNDQSKIEHVSSQAAGDKPLAQSALSGEARLRELEHLAETARKVRDQAAAELTRNSGSTHHVARERMAAAERMLRKTQQEIADLCEQLGTPGPSATPAKDFELAVMLGHSRARFNLDGASQYSLEDRPVVRASRDAKAAPPKRGMRAPSLWRTLTFGLLIAAGIGISIPAFYGFVATGTMEGAAQAVQEGTAHVMNRLRDLVTLPSDTGRATASLT